MEFRETLVLRDVEGLDYRDDRRGDRRADRHRDVAPRARPPPADGATRKGFRMTDASDDPILLVHAYCDGELDPANALALERRMAEDPRLAAERDRIVALKRAMGRLGRPRRRRGCAPASSVRSACAARRRARPGARSRPRSCSRSWCRRRDLVGARRPRRRLAADEVRRQSHPRADGAAAVRRRVVRPAHRQAVVQRPHGRRRRAWSISPRTAFRWSADAST